MVMRATVSSINSTVSRRSISSTSWSTSVVAGGRAAAMAGPTRPRIRVASIPEPSASRSLFTRTAPPTIFSRLRSLTSLALFLGGGAILYFYYMDSRSGIHRWVAIPVLQATMNPETAQKLAIRMLESGIAPVDMAVDDEVLATELFGKTVSNPIGLSAGFDKQAQAIDGLLRLGFGLVEVGSVTPEPQPGNPQPRYFRLPADDAAINRFGFNSDGHEVVLNRLRDRIRRWALGLGTSDLVPILDSSVSPQDVGLGLTTAKASGPALLAAHATSSHTSGLVDGLGVPRSLHSGQSLWVNLGKNKTSAEDSPDDYVKGVQRLGPYADVLVINVSSPNTPGLRALQGKEKLLSLLKSVSDARDELEKKTKVRTPLVVKVTADLDEQALRDVGDAAVQRGIDGILVSNTTISRPETLLSAPELVAETGGLSGPPLKPLALHALRTLNAHLSDKSIALIGCGGISNGQDALDYAKAGADAVQLYTSFGYQGVGLPRRIKDQLTTLLREENTTWAAVVRGARDNATARAALRDESKIVQDDGTIDLRAGEDTFRRTVAGVKAELESLRSHFGLGASDVGSYGPAQTIQIANSKKEKAAEKSGPRKAPSGPFTALKTDLFWQAPADDKEYATLLDSVHKALGVAPAPHQQTGVEDAAAAATSSKKDDGKKGQDTSRPKTKGELVAAALDRALFDPRENPSVPRTGDATSSAKSSRTASSPAELVQDDLAHLASIARSKVDSGAISSGGIAAPAEGLDYEGASFRVGMGGPRPDFKLADKMRVV